MQYASKDLIDQVNAHIAQDEEYRRQTLECIEAKKAAWARQVIREIMVERNIIASDAEVEQCVQEFVLWTKTQEPQLSNIVVTEIQL